MTIEPLRNRQICRPGCFRQEATALPGGQDPDADADVVGNGVPEEPQPGSAHALLDLGLSAAPVWHAHS